MFHYPYTAVTPAMAMQIVGVGSQYGVITVDSDGNYLDGSRSYSLTLPAGIPAKDFWSFVNYDPQTRSILQAPTTAQPSVSSNWVPTVPGKGWFTVLRLYGPLEPWFEKSWRPGEIKVVD
jgi:hypothetical protein